MRLARHAKEALRGLHDIDGWRLADACLREIVDDPADIDCAPELSKRGRTLRSWHHQIINWHHAWVTNVPTEAVILWSVSEKLPSGSDGSPIPDPSAALRREIRDSSTHRSSQIGEEPDLSATNVGIWTRTYVTAITVSTNTP